MPSFAPAAGSHASPRSTADVILERAQAQWLFVPSELQRTPSILDGMSSTQEAANRSKGINFITQVGILLKLPQMTLATASIYLHRFFMRHSMVDQPGRPGLHHYAVAATALFLATKVEENCRKMRELVVACCRVAQKQPNLLVDEQSKEYWKWRDTILHNEDLLLEALCFDLQLEQPYRILFDFLCYYGVQENKRLRNASWAFLNDSHITPMCLMFPARTIASSALYGGIVQAGAKLPDNERGQPWWDHLGVDVQDLRRAWNLMAEIYENAALPRQSEKDAYLKNEDPAAFEQTRFASSPRNGLSPDGSVGSGSQGLKRDRSSLEGEEAHANGELERVRGSSDDRLNVRNVQHTSNGTHPSPKRQRLDTPIEHSASQSLTRAEPTPSQNGRPDSASSEVDNVQQRIDEIIDASANQTGPQPPLSRHPSNSSAPQQKRTGPPPRRRSSSISLRQRPPSQERGPPYPPDYRQVQLRQPSYDRDPEVRRPPHALPRRPSLEYRPEQQFSSYRGRPPSGGGRENGAYGTEIIELGPSTGNRSRNSDRPEAQDRFLGSGDDAVRRRHPIDSDNGSEEGEV